MSRFRSFWRGRLWTRHIFERLHKSWISPQNRSKPRQTFWMKGPRSPFIARYRKEATGSLDEIAVTAVRDDSINWWNWTNAVKRSSIIRGTEQLTDELKEKILTAETMRHSGRYLFTVPAKTSDPGNDCQRKGTGTAGPTSFFTGWHGLNGRGNSLHWSWKGIESAEDASQGPRHHCRVGQWRSGSQAKCVTSIQRRLFSSQRLFSRRSRGDQVQGLLWLEEPVGTAPSHRILAMRRGEKEDFLTLRILPPEEEALGLLEGLLLKGKGHRPSSQDGCAW